MADDAGAQIANNQMRAEGETGIFGAKLCVTPGMGAPIGPHHLVFFLLPIITITLPIRSRPAQDGVGRLYLSSCGASGTPWVMGWVSYFLRTSFAEFSANLDRFAHYDRVLILSK